MRNCRYRPPDIRQKSGKRVLVWAVEGDLDPETAVSNSFQMEWPPRSERIREFPEIDRVAWFDLDEARVKIRAAQARSSIASNGWWHRRLGREPGSDRRAE